MTLLSSDPPCTAQSRDSQRNAKNEIIVQHRSDGGDWAMGMWVNMSHKGMRCVGGGVMLLRRLARRCHRLPPFTALHTRVRVHATARS